MSTFHDLSAMRRAFQQVDEDNDAEKSFKSQDKQKIYSSMERNTDNSSKPNENRISLDSLDDLVSQTTAIVDALRKQNNNYKRRVTLSSISSSSRRDNASYLRMRRRSVDSTLLRSNNSIKSNPIYGNKKCNKPTECKKYPSYAESKNDSAQTQRPESNNSDYSNRNLKSSRDKNDFQHGKEHSAKCNNTISPSSGKENQINESPEDTAFYKEREKLEEVVSLQSHM